MSEPDNWRETPSMVTLVKRAYEESSFHQRSQIRAFISALPENTGLGDTQRLNWILENCDVIRRKDGPACVHIVRRSQIDFQLKKKHHEPTA